MGTTRGTIKSSLSLSRAIRSAPDTPADKALFLSIHPISRQSDFMVPTNFKRKDNVTRSSSPPCDYHLMRPCPPYHYPFPAKADVVLLPCPPWHYHCVQEQGGNAAIPTWPLPPSFQEQGGNAAIPTWQVPLCSQGQGNNAASPTLS